MTDVPKTAAPRQPGNIDSSSAVRLLGELPVGIIHAVEERIVFANGAVAEMIGEPVERMVGASFFDYIDPSDFARVGQRYWDRQHGRPTVPARYEAGLRHSSGRRLLVELEPRAVGPRELVVMIREIEARAHDSALLSALAELAVSVQRAHTSAEVFEIAGEGLRRLGMNMLAMVLRDGGLVVEHASLSDAASALISSALGGSIVGRSARLAEAGLARQAFLERNSIFVDDVGQFAGRFFSRFEPKLQLDAFELQFAKARVGKAALCPIFLHGDEWGLLGVASDSLSSADAAALGLFAAQVASSLEISETIADLEQRNRVLATVHAVAAAGSVNEVDELLPMLLEIAAGATDSDLAAIYLSRPDGHELELAGSFGLARSPAGKRVRFEKMASRIAQGFSLRAPASERQLPGELRDLLLGEGVRELAMVPMDIKGRPAGVLYVGRRTEVPFTADELRYAEVLGGQIAIQLENGRLYGEASRRLRYLSVLFELSRMGAETVQVAPLVEQVLEKVTGAIGADGAAIYLVKGDKLVAAGARGSSQLQLARVAELPLDGNTPMGRVALERRPLMEDLAYLDEEQRMGVRILAAAPLIAKDQLIGVFSVARNQPQLFSEEELKLLEGCAAQVAVSLEHARLFEEERRRVEELKLVVEMGRLITASLDLDRILDASAVSLARMAGASHSYIWLLDPKKGDLVAAATSTTAHREFFNSRRIGLDEPSAAACAVRTRAPLLVTNAVESRDVQSELVARFKHKSLFSLPLMQRDEPMGAVVVADDDEREWTEGQVERASVVASQVAVAVANARLYEDLKRSYQTLARTQEQLVRRERLAALGELAAVVAHEVRNPLGVIFNSLVSLRRVLKPQGDAAMLLDIVGEEADRLNRIVGDLLDFARPTEPSLQPEPLTSLVAGALDAAAALAGGSKVELRVHQVEPMPSVPVDARMLRQAILNLVINGVQAMPKGGAIDVYLSTEEKQGRKLALIEVADNGPGVPPDLTERIFQPFFTTKAAGTGLGLAVVKRIVEAHHGELTLTSRPGEGARFTVRLPVEAR